MVLAAIQSRESKQLGHSHDAVIGVRIS